METLSNSPLLLLRQHNQSFKQRQRRLNRRLRNKGQLREEIYSNHNIFQSSVDLSRNMTAQNLIWDKNYHCKCAMNRVKEENSALKARIWNLEKENRKMERQVDAWNLKDFVNVPNSRKPYIDMATVEKVLADQDYSIVSTKMEIAQLEAQLQEREATFSKLTERNREVGKIVSLLNHEIAVGKVSVCECIELETGVTGAMRGQFRQQMGLVILGQNRQLDLIAKNREIKKKSRGNIENELQVVSRECELRKNVTCVEMERLGEEVRRMQTEEDGGLGLEKGRVRAAQRETLDFECYMQSRMGDFIKRKIPLRMEIERLRQALCRFEGQQSKIDIRK